MRELTAVALADLSPGVEPGAGHVRDSWSYVPATVVRGALAAAWIRRHGPPTGAPAARRQEFEELFERSVRYGPLLASGSAIEPLSVLRCKYRPEADCEATVADLAEEPDAHRSLEDGERGCPVCEGPLALGKGRVVGAPLVERTHVKLDEHGVASSGDLFSRRAIPKGTRLVGQVHGAPDGLADLVAEPVWFGGRRSTGGLARLDLGPSSSAEPDARTDGHVIVRLVSPAVVVDASTRPRLRFDASDLEATLGCPVEVVAQWVRPVRIGGWHAASGLPKPQDLALAPGSTVVARPQGQLAPGALEALSVEGVGLRRAEGFGSVVVNPRPWTPPGRTATEARPPVDREGEAAELAAELEKYGLRGWLADLLREHAARIVTEPGAALDLRARPRLRRVPPSVLDRIDGLASGARPDELRRAATIIDSGSA